MRGTKGELTFTISISELTMMFMMLMVIMRERESTMVVTMIMMQFPMIKHVRVLKNINIYKINCSSEICTWKKSVFRFLCECPVCVTEEVETEKAEKKAEMETNGEKEMESTGDKKLENQNEEKAVSDVEKKSGLEEEEEEVDVKKESSIEGLQAA